MKLYNVVFTPDLAGLDLAPYAIGLKFTLYPGKNMFNEKSLETLQDEGLYQFLDQQGVIVVEEIEQKLTDLGKTTQKISKAS